MCNTTDVCCLCGKPATKEDTITKEHVPPRQFFPKSIRNGLNLWTNVPTHRSCNNSYKEDEEYFYHVLYPLVANANPQMASIILDDLKRRAKKPQTPTRLRKILRTAKTTTRGGIILPPGKVCLEADKDRIQRVAIKIGRCLFYRDYKQVMPYENCKDIRLCEREEDVPELYKLSWELSKVNETSIDPEAGTPFTEYSQVFDYRPAYIESEQSYLYSMRFWDAFMFCLTFQAPDA